MARAKGAEEAGLGFSVVAERTPSLRNAAPTAGRHGDALLRLALAEGLGPIGVGLLLDAFGTGEAVLAAEADGWATALGCLPERAARIRRSAQRAEVDAERSAAAAVGAALLTRLDADYPALLAAIPDPPPVVWIRGRLPAEGRWSVAVVGSRRPSAYGIDQAARFSQALAAEGIAVVSGGARGIDAEAHRSTLRAGGLTVAVLGGGIGQPYPPEHAPLFDAIVDAGGAVLSEQPVGMPPRPPLFPRRNRIIAGLAVGVLVVEARERSGASITARIAVEDLGREAMALPGRVDMPTSAGCLRAIREGWAGLVRTPEDLFEQLASARHLCAGAAHARLERRASPPRAAPAGGSGPAPQRPRRALDPLEQRILDLVAECPRSPDGIVDSLIDQSGSADEPPSPGAILACLTALELSGILGKFPNGTLGPA
jgi:DNA processing protein